jgi:hypothetical protein
LLEKHIGQAIEIACPTFVLWVLVPFFLDQIGVEGDQFP